MADSLLIFSHIPKTGGLTMRRIIDQHFKPRQIFKYPSHHAARSLRSLSASDVAPVRCVYGHCPFGVHQYFHKPFKYITMVRDPVSRIISTYYFIRSSPSNKLHSKVKRMSFEQFVTSKNQRIQTPLTNHQTRFISGKKNPDLKLAIDNIREHYAFVGITEMYPESVFLLNRMMGWRQTPYTKENITKSRPKKAPVSNDIIQYIKEKNALDYMLYEYCKARLLKKIEQLPPAAKKKMAQFARVNR
ncbi:sulfotransferase family 2 domain-containing protein [Paenactinomyces guangxiensis]|uniref:Sulfotransferase family 2 domain-containing protein n=1 Tax=Paenactinomyces guangxiensis TaxID=1490290 RepID=A0A7W1WN79_9BACL|nr:sulfotransferase family 2 domain-containing protein [Paenactinomyces guangxiensis]MBA4493028.1 sulfotransferase family 2 domain-containing protein [Paenactinomyces guangxiensis]MBH8590123.1 sulfotransferase family 2 domain-containing protein [Paenactinomyces guangxiensis]